MSHWFSLGHPLRGQLLLLQSDTPMAVGWDAPGPWAPKNVEVIHSILPLKRSRSCSVGSRGLGPRGRAIIARGAAPGLTQDTQPEGPTGRAKANSAPRWGFQPGMGRVPRTSSWAMIARPVGPESAKQNQHNNGFHISPHFWEPSGTLQSPIKQYVSNH